MNEFSTYELAVPQKKEGKWRVYRIALILLYVFFVLGCFILGIAFNVLPPLALVPVFTWMLIFFTWRYVSVEYEYSITSGELTFSKIYGNRSRRVFLKLALRDAVRIAPLQNEEEARRAEAFRPEHEFSAISSLYAPDIYFILFEYPEGKGANAKKVHAIFYMEMTKKALQICRFYNPAATVLSTPTR